MPEFVVVRIRETTILDETLNPIEAYRVYFEIEGLDETYHIDAPKAGADTERIQEMVEREVETISEILDLGA